MSKGLVAMLAVAAVGGAAFIATRQKSASVEVQALHAIDAQDASLVKSMADHFDAHSRAAMQAVAAVMPTQEDILEGFATALAFADGITQEWIQAFADVGRTDLARKLIDILHGIVPTESPIFPDPEPEPPKPDDAPPDEPALPDEPGAGGGTPGAGTGAPESAHPEFLPPALRTTSLSGKEIWSYGGIQTIGAGGEWHAWRVDDSLNGMPLTIAVSVQHPEDWIAFFTHYDPPGSVPASHSIVYKMSPDASHQHQKWMLNNIAGITE